MWPFKKDPIKEDQRNLNAKEADIRLKQGASFIGSSNDPLTTPTRDNAKTYPYDYFAGTDCKIFFGDIWVDDIVTLQYTVSQSKSPIYGYASQNFDAVARGQVIVEGNLAVSFKEVGYLNVIQAQLESQRKKTQSTLVPKIENYDSSQPDKQRFIPGFTSINNGVKGEKVDFAFSSTGTPQIIRQQETIEQILAKKKGKNNLSSSAVGNYFGSNAGDFEDFAEVLEDSIWGDSNGKPKVLNDKLKRVDEFDYSENGGIITAKNTAYSDVLNIMLTFGDLNDYRAEHTIILLNDVHFTTTSMIVSPDGNPIAEVYSFIARDINKSLNFKTGNIDKIKLMVGNDQIKISELENIDKVQQFIEKNNGKGNKISIIQKAELSKGGWSSRNIELISNYEITFNKITSFTDQLIDTIERLINDSTLTDVAIDSSQIIITVEFASFKTNGDFSFDAANNITMILEQSIANTYTYKVISPTRSGFKANNFISRDNLFDAPPEVIKADAPLSKDTQDKNKETLQKKFVGPRPFVGPILTPEEVAKRQTQATQETQKKEKIAIDAALKAVKLPVEFQDKNKVDPVVAALKRKEEAQAIKNKSIDTTKKPDQGQLINEKPTLWFDQVTPPSNVKDNVITPSTYSLTGMNWFNYEDSKIPLKLQPPIPLTVDPATEGVKESSTVVFRGKPATSQKSTPKPIDYSTAFVKSIPTKLTEDQKKGLAFAEGSAENPFGRIGLKVFLAGQIEKQTKQLFETNLKKEIAKDAGFTSLSKSEQNRILLENINKAAKGSEGERRLLAIIKKANIKKEDLDAASLKALQEVNKVSR
jgi:hypothetical protein